MAPANVGERAICVLSGREFVLLPTDFFSEQLFSVSACYMGIQRDFTIYRFLISKLSQEVVFCGEAEGLRPQRHASVEATLSSNSNAD